MWIAAQAYMHRDCSLSFLLPYLRNHYTVLDPFHPQDLLSDEWLKTVAEDLDVFIAQHNFEAAVELVQRSMCMFQRCVRSMKQVLLLFPFCCFFFVLVYVCFEFEDVLR